MKAIRIASTGDPGVLELVDAEPPALEPGSVLIRQTAAGVNFIDIYMRLGVYPHALPFIVGREGVGIVEAVAPDISSVRVGMRVGYADTPHFGGYAQLNAVPAPHVIEIPAGIADDVACAAMLQGLTAQYLVTDSYAVKSGDHVLVHAAAGGVGRILVQLAKARGATVIATAGGPAKTALAASAGADHTIDYRAVDFEPEVKRLTGGAGVDVVYDAVGKDTFERSLRSLRVRGSFVLYGAASGPVPPVDPQQLSRAGSIFFSRPTAGHFMRTNAELRGRATEVFGAILGGTLDVRVGHTYPLADAAQAHRDLEARATTGKLILVP